MNSTHALRALVMCAVVGLAFPAGSSGMPLPDRYSHGSLEVDVGFFYDELAPYGDWVEVDEYGWVWTPRMHHDWRPYTVGHWVWTDDHGWLWVSDEDFGWAVYHYGRWTYHPAYGWVWVPGDQWAPAWVAWRSGGGYIGWAPLPPRVEWSAGVGLRFGAADLDALIEPRTYCFVEERGFADTGLRRRLLPATRNTAIVNVTRNVTSYSVVERRVVNRGVSIERVERATGRRVPRPRVVEVGSVRATHDARMRGSEVAVFRPAIRPAAESSPAHGRALGKTEARDPHLEAREREMQRAQREAARRDGIHRTEVEKDQERDRKAFEKQRETERREAERRLAREREQHERERRDLGKRQAHERDAVERQHDTEIKHPPQDIASRELERRHEEQHRQLEQRQHREREELEARREQARQERDAQAAGERRASSQPEKPEKKESREKERPKDKHKDRAKDKPGRS